jgi:hypothetical protein
MGWQGHNRLPVHPVPSRLVTRAELADELRVSIATVDRRIADGMPVIRFSPGTVRIDVQQAIAWAAERYTKQIA